MTDINKLNEEELVELKSQIDDRLKKLEADEKDLIDKNKGKTKLSQLTISDRIFGIGVSGNSKTPDGISANWDVHIIDYCRVIEYTDKSKRGNEWHRLSINHHKSPFGISISLNDSDVDKPYLLNINTFSCGYDSFFTLRPETWEADILSAYHEQIELRRKHHERDNQILMDKLNLFLREKDRINDKVIHPL